MERRAIGRDHNYDAFGFFDVIRDLAVLSLCDRETLAEIVLDFDAGRGSACHAPDSEPLAPEIVGPFLGCGEPGEVIAFSLLAGKIPAVALNAAMDRRAVWRFCARHQPDVRMRCLAFLAPRGYDEKFLENMRREFAVRVGGARRG